MGKFGSKTIISVGFSIIILLIIALLFVWIDTVSQNKAYLSDVQQKQDEIFTLSSLSKLQSKRMGDAYRLVAEDKASHRQKIIQQMSVGSDDIASLSKKLIEEHEDERHEKLWLNVVESLSQYSIIEEKVVALVMAEKVTNAQKMLINQLMGLNDKIVATIQVMLNEHRLVSKAKLTSAIDRNESVYYLLVMMGFAVILLALLNIFVIRHTGIAETALLAQGNRIRKLYEITSKPGLSTEEQIRSMLKLGCQLLGMQIGKVSQLDEEKNTNSFLNVYAPVGFSICAGTVMPLDKTFCSITIKSKDTIALHDVSKSIYGKKFSHLAAYIATTIAVNGKPYGSVNFSSNDPRPQEFSETDKDLVKLIGAWVSSTLERRFAQEDLVIAKNEAEAASRTKSSFLANMSHELRTPLNAIIGYSELIKEEAAFNGHNMYEKDLHTVNSSALHLLGLIDDILDLSKIEAGKMELYLEEFSITDLVSEVAETVTPLMAKKNNVFNVTMADDLGSMNSDRLKLKQVLLNLLSNASKFTEDGDVSLVVKLNHKNLDENNQPTEVEFVVEDTGIGISDQQISKIFQAFAQADVTTTSKYGGTGLGLAISRQICQLLKGDVQAKGAIGQGTSFIVTIPLGLVHAS